MATPRTLRSSALRSRLGQKLLARTTPKIDSAIIVGSAGGISGPVGIVRATCSLRRRRRLSLGGHKSRWNDGGVFPDDANTQSAASASRSNETTARPRATKRGSFATSLKRARETERGLERALRFLSVWSGDFVSRERESCPLKKSFLLTKKILDGNQSIQSDVRRDGLSHDHVVETSESARGRLVGPKTRPSTSFCGRNGGYVVGRERGVKAQKMDDDIARSYLERENCDIASQKSSGSSQWASFRTYETADGSRKFFVKLSRKDDAMFRGEKAGLDALRRASTGVRYGDSKVYYAGGVPDGCRDGNSMIVMEYLNFGARGDQEEFGLALRCTTRRLMVCKSLVSK